MIKYLITYFKAVLSVLFYVSMDSTRAPGKTGRNGLNRCIVVARCSGNAGNAGTSGMVAAMITGYQEDKAAGDIPGQTTAGQKILYGKTNNVNQQS